MRTYDLNKVVAAVAQYSEELSGFIPEEWLADKDNVALINENNDIALFERQRMNPVSVHGHYFFFSRGKEAVKAAEGFLKEIFEGPYEVGVIVGLTPVTHKGALWMNRRLGFKSMGIVPTTEGDHETVVLTKTQWSN